MQSEALNIWKKYGLWAPPEEMLSGRAVGNEESRNQGKNGPTVISGGGKKRFKASKVSSENGYGDPELSGKEILKRVRNILGTIGVYHKEWTS